MKKHILFVCIHNSARSQMAEAFVNQLAGDRFEAESAGIEPGRMNPIVVKAMQEDGIDLAGRPTKSVDSMIARGPYFDYVVTVCDETSAERCPAFPGGGTRLHWPFADPSSFQGADEEKLAGTRFVRDEIKSKIEEWITACPA
jgi:arsenate reductase (thioredoxin)